MQNGSVTLEKGLAAYLKKLNINTNLPYDPAIPVLEIGPREMKKMST